MRIYWKDLTDHDAILGQMGRATCGQRKWRNDRGFRLTLTEQEANEMIQKFEQPIRIELDQLSPPPDNASYSSAFASVATPRQMTMTSTMMMTMMTPRDTVTVTPRLLVEGYPNQNWKERTKGVFRFATADDVIRDVSLNGKRNEQKKEDHRRLTGPDASSSCKKKRSSTPSSTTRPRKDPPSPPPSADTTNEPHSYNSDEDSTKDVMHHHPPAATTNEPPSDDNLESGSIGTFQEDEDEILNDYDSNEDSTRDVMHCFEGLPVHSFQEDEDDSDRERLIDFLNRKQTALVEWERRIAATSDGRRNDQILALKDDVRTVLLVLRVYTLLPGVDARPCKYCSSIQSQACRSARKTIVAIWKELCENSPKRITVKGPPPRAKMMVPITIRLAMPTTPAAMGRISTTTTITTVTMVTLPMSDRWGVQGNRIPTTMATTLPTATIKVFGEVLVHRMHM
jgi:hypothetical protein